MAVYTKPTQAQAQAWFDRIKFMLETEVIQNANGSWGGGYIDLEPVGGDECTGTHPLVFEAAHAAILYIYGYRTNGDEALKTRAINTLNWILTEQTSGGGFNHWCTNAGGVEHYDTGLAGRTLIEGYIAFNDIRYRDASIKAYTWEKNQGPVANNANFNSFPITHMVRLYETLNDPAVLSTALTYSKYMVDGDPNSYQTSGGYWSDDHNQHYYYHMMITRALLGVLANLPSNHPDRSYISNATNLAFNYIATHQKSDGSMWFTPFIQTSGLYEDEDYIIDGLIQTMGRTGIDVENVLNGFMQYQFSRPYTGINATGSPPDSERGNWREPFENKPVGAGIALKYYTGCPALNVQIGLTQ